MKILIDMNLSPQWVEFLERNAVEAIHWSAVGDIRAPDHILMKWARDNGHVILTRDLDFGTLLALTHADGPSVIQLRAHDTMPSQIGETIGRVLEQYGTELETGSLVVVSDDNQRVRALPLRP